MFAFRVVAALSCALFFCAPLWANDWAHHRGGPEQQGQASGTLANRLEQQWSFKAEGPVHSSPIVIKDRVFIGSNDGFLYALDLNTGAKIWRYETGGAVEAAPTVIGGRVVVGASDGWIYALDAEKGTLDWKFETKAKVMGAVTSADEDSLFVGSYDGNLYALEASTGKKRWVYETGNYIHGSPAIWKGHVVIGGCDQKLHIVAIKSGEKVGMVPLGAQMGASPAIVGDVAYLGTYGKEFYEIDLKHKAISWVYKDRDFPYFSSPTVDEKRVYFGGRDRRIHAVNREDGRAAWTYQTRGKVDGSLILVDGKIVAVSTEGRIHLIRAVDGEKLWSYDLGANLIGSPGVSSGRVILGTGDGIVYCFGPKKRAQKRP